MPPSVPPLSVRELAELGALFEAHWGRLVGIARRRLDGRLAGRLDPEELVNQAFLDARRRWPAYRADRPVSEFVWLYRLVTDRVIEAWRTAARGRRDVTRNVPWPDRPSLDLGLRLAAAGPGPGTAAEQRETADRIAQAVDRLPAADREVIRLRAYDDLGFKEVGELLGVSENTATVRYVRAIRRLKAVWRELTGEGSRP